MRQMNLLLKNLGSMPPIMTLFEAQRPTSLYIRLSRFIFVSYLYFMT